MILPDKKYNIIYADPAWKFNDKKTGGSMSSGAASKYTVSSIELIKSLPVVDICEKNCVLIMWWVASMPQEALDVVNAWGFKLKTMSGFDWVKKTKNDKFHFGMGHQTRAGSEDALIAMRGRVPRASAAVRQMVFEAGMPIGLNGRVKHSAKPPVVRDKIVELYGDLPRIELFARENAEGWDCAGDEIMENCDV